MLQSSTAALVCPELAEDTQLAKQKAEAEAEDAVSRLRVHQLQVSEWASERATDCASLLSLVDTLASSGLAAEHAELLRKLKATLETQQHEAQELSKEAKADAERQNRRGRTAAEVGSSVAVPTSSSYRQPCSDHSAELAVGQGGTCSAEHVFVTSGTSVALSRFSSALWQGLWD
jgi:hypothetical protein